MRYVIGTIATLAITGCSLFTEPDTVKSGKQCNWFSDTSHTVTPNRDTVTMTVTRRECTP
jgi:hypothetical protein